MPREGCIMGRAWANTISVACRAGVLAICALTVLFIASGLLVQRAFAAEQQGALQAQSPGVVGVEKAQSAPAKGMVKSCVSRKAGSITVKAAAVTSASKYQFAISKSRSFRVGGKTAMSETNSYTFNVLDSGKTYYVRVRACKSVDGKDVWGAWSNVKSKKTKMIKFGFVSLNSSPSGPAVNWWKNCGFKIVGITSTKDPDLKKVDGVLVPGGRDVNPKYYGEKKNPHTVLENAKVDALKLAVCKICAKIKMPLLGICGGEQTLNVALGGTLKQHIPTGYHSGWRKVKIAKGSWLYKMWGKTESTHHSHHQCVKKLGKGLIATQWDARDGYIEAIEHVSLPLYGVQWHPENMGEKGRKVARSFARICMKYNLKNR